MTRTRIHSRTLRQIVAEVLAASSPAVVTAGLAACGGVVSAALPSDAGSGSDVTAPTTMDAGDAPEVPSSTDAGSPAPDATFPTLFDASIEPDSGMPGYDAALPPCDWEGGFYYCECQVTLSSLPLEAGAPVEAGPGLPGLPPWGTSADGIPCTALCGEEYGWCEIADAGPPFVVSCGHNCTGRRPAGLEMEATLGRTAGDYFASMAQLEAASVPAFRRMAQELSAFGAPPRLVRGARRAARDEIRHARAARAMAKRFGARAAGFSYAPFAERSLEDLAIENAVEGCVRETYGALVATWQAEVALDLGVRAHMARIARDETEHAALAWRVDAWVRGRLGRDARGRLEAAKRRARTELEAAILTEKTGEAVERIAGAPGKATALALVRRLELRS